MEQLKNAGEDLRNLPEFIKGLDCFKKEEKETYRCFQSKNGKRNKLPMRARKVEFNYR